MGITLLAKVSTPSPGIDCRIRVVLLNDDETDTGQSADRAC
jgi:hypothetical protein